MTEDEFKKLNFSVLGKNSYLEGEFKFTGETLLNCKLKGSILMQDDAKLTLERSSEVEGQIYAHNVEVFGSFTGSINASGTLSIRSSAKISGKIQAGKLSIFPGAHINFEGSTLDDEPSKNSVNTD